MDERTPAQQLAHTRFITAKHWAKVGYATAGRLTMMRNAVVAYHAGAPWTVRAGATAKALCHALDENAQLRAEVERLRQIAAKAHDDGMNAGLRLRDLTRDEEAALAETFFARFFRSFKFFERFWKM